MDWRAILSRLSQPDLWGPTGLYPLDGFRRTGKGWVARCPSGTHPDRHPSFSMPEGKPFGRCFSCGYGRTWIGYVLEQRGHPPDAKGPAFREALEILAGRAGVSLEFPGAGAAPDPAARARTAAAAYLKQALLGESPAAVACRRYLASRGVPESLLPQLPVGALDDPVRLRKALTAQGIPASVLVQTGLLAAYVVRHPLIFFYTDLDGIAGFKCRVPDPTRKDVLNAKGFGGEAEGRSLFALDVAREAIAAAGAAIAMEGEFDVLPWLAAALARGTVIELVALGGSSKPTVEKFQTLRAVGARLVYFAFDADRAGQLATAAACPLAWEAGLEVFVLPMVEGTKDPDEALQQLGLEAAQAALFAHERVQPGAGWLARWLLAEHPPTAPDLAARLRRVASDTATLMSPVQREVFATALADPLGVAVDALQKEWAAATRQRREAALRQELLAWARQFPAALAKGALAERLAEAERVLAGVRTRLEAVDPTRGPPPG